MARHSRRAFLEHGFAVHSGDFFLDDFARPPILIGLRKQTHAILQIDRIYLGSGCRRRVPYYRQPALPILHNHLMLYSKGMESPKTARKG